MPLYEVILDSGEQQEVRLTDQSLAVGDVLEMQSIHWEVVRAFAATHGLARYVCRRLQETDGEMRRRAEVTRIRLEGLRIASDPPAV